jgi:hypothetical protein
MAPTWYHFVEEKLPLPCPLLHVITMALAQKTIATPGFDTAEAFFNADISVSSGKIEWDKEF